VSDQFFLTLLQRGKMVIYTPDSIKRTDKDT